MRHEFGYINVVRTKKFTDKGKNMFMALILPQQARFS